MKRGKNGEQMHANARKYQREKKAQNDRNAIRAMLESNA